MKTIIKISTVMVFMLSSQLISAQQSLEIIGVPENSYGYLVWKTDPAVVAYSICSILRHEIVGSDTIVSIEQRTEIWDRNYFKIPDQYWKNNPGPASYSADVTVYDSNHNIISGEDAAFGPIGGVGVELECTNTTCVSTNYAYRIRVVEVGGQYTYTQEQAYALENDEGMQVPYYRYFTPDEFGLYTGLFVQNQAQGNPNHHGLGIWHVNMVPDVPSLPLTFASNINNTMVVIRNTPAITYCDNTGSEINTSIVYGIQKARWHWWVNPYRVLFSNINHCGQGTFSTVQGYIDFMNQHTNNAQVPDDRPVLECWADLSGPNCAYIDFGDDDPSPTIGSLTVSIKYKPDTGDDGDDDDDDGSELGLILADCELFNITTLTQNPVTNVNMSGSDFIDATGAPAALSITLEAGLHKMTLKMPNQHLQYSVFETTQTQIFSIPHKDYFDAVIYPNPNIEGYYFIDMESSAHLRPKYEVFDGMGTKLWEQDFDLPQGHEGTHRIQPQANFPNGYILHKFTFEDGSTETITTLKQ